MMLLCALLLLPAGTSGRKLLASHPHPVADALSAQAGLLEKFAMLPPLPTSIASAFTFFCSGQFAQSRVCTRLSPIVTQLSSPALAPPILSTVDPTATIYIPNPSKP